ncbi:MAG: tRNA (adenosine(37)-N6)-dimethylallyltransferase MiaA, partial [Eudoraea sp.]|nr:tRNA (adenosine(37)-N6)-dimethylallyltransferase MiaA [Eudoraea sp.]
MKDKTLIVVIGPTGIGKTSLAIKLAKHYQTSIISADSRQFYKEMSIGTAVPTKEELTTVPHHFIQHKSILESYTVGDFEREALEVLQSLFKTTDIVIMAGGSGLYIDAVVHGLDIFPPVDEEVRQKLNKELEDSGLEGLQAQLKKLDPIYYGKVDLFNSHRVIRALEVCLSSGKPYSSFLNKNKSPRNFKTIILGITAPRNVVYERINTRVDTMMEEGLLIEVKGLTAYTHLNALQTVGYKELFRFLKGDCTLDEAIEEIKKNTRRFAKRQGTW